MTTGPSHWGDDYHTCIGKHQSPINIEEHDVRNVTYPPLRFSGLDVPRTTEIKNNGHTGMIYLFFGFIKYFLITRRFEKYGIKFQREDHSG